MYFTHAVILIPQAIVEALLLPSSYILLLFFFTSVDLFSVKIDDETDHYFLYLPVVLLNIISAIYYCKLQRNVERKVREGQQEKNVDISTRDLGGMQKCIQ